MTGHVNCKLCSCASMCPTNAHSLPKAISVKFPQKCALTFFFLHVRKFQYFWRVQVERTSAKFLPRAPPTHTYPAPTSKKNTRFRCSLEICDFRS